MNVEKQAAAATLRCLSIEGGIVALSPRRIWMKTKMILIKPNATSRQMILAEFQLYIVPPI
jgi:hypothetical protein